MLQSGGDLFPLDSTGETISDNTTFLDTWEVSWNVTIKQLQLVSNWLVWNASTQPISPYL